MGKWIYSVICVSVFFALLLANPFHAQAGWSSDPTVNVVISANPDTFYQDENPSMISDGAGGAIIAWWHQYSIYVQRIDANGNVLWGADGKAISTFGGEEYYPQLASDGAGGAIVTWHENSDGSGGIYAQRVDSSGNALWSPGGKNICNAAGNHQYPRIVSDAVGGAIVTWQDSRNGGSNYDIYAQRVDPFGVELWPVNGRAVCTAAGHQYYPQIISDGGSGAIITWQDGRAWWDIYVQSIDANGNLKWTADGLPITADPNSQHAAPQIASDGASGAIISWHQDVGKGNGWNVYAQRIDMNGIAKWAPGGVAISSGINHQRDPQIVSDGSGGAVISWWDINSSSGVSNGVFAQRINANGIAQWSVNGVTVATPAQIQTDYYSPQIVSDGSHGAVITWADQRNSTDRNIYAQRIDGTTGVAL